MLRPRRNTQSSRVHSAAYQIRQRIEAGGENYWKPSDFPDAATTAVTKTLSRLARNGVLQRVGKGIYYHPRATVLGMSRPTPDAILARRLTRPLMPAGLTAANLLGFSTQNPGRREFATTASSVAFCNDALRVTTRRPECWTKLTSEDAALLNFIRGRTRNSELSEEGTKERLFTLLRAPRRFERLVAVAPTEPPRVRAMLGAIGQEMEIDAYLISELRKGLNPRSRFEFGPLRILKHAREWQAK